MKFDELFEQRSLVASKLKDCIRDLGYTKVSLLQKQIFQDLHLINY